MHDISMPSQIGSSEEHHIYGAKIADELLTKLNYPQQRKELVIKCVLNHRGSKNFPRNSVEEQCVADADVIAHFDRIPSLFSLAFAERKLSIYDGTEFVKQKLERDYNKLSDKGQTLLKNRYENIKRVLFKD